MPRAAGRDLDPDRERWGSGWSVVDWNWCGAQVAYRMNVRMMSISEVEVKVGCNVVRVVGVDVVERGMAVRRVV